MQHDEFEGYLRALPELGDDAVDDCLSRCKRLEKHEGDLDAHFDDDRMEDLIDRLAYSTEDERRGRQPRHKVHIDGNQREGSASLKKAARRYRDFRAGI